MTTHASWWRRRWWSELVSDRLGDLQAPGTDTVDLHVDVWTALGHLPPRQRAVLVLRYFEDLTEAETAEVLGCAVGTVKSQHAKAMRRLRSDRSVDVSSQEAPT